MAKKPFLHYHLAGSQLSAARNGANYLLIDSMVNWGCREGYGTFHLGGGTRPDDGLFRFKLGFGGSLLEFWLGKVVISPDEYRQLSATRALQLDPDGGTILGDFFPAYRTQR